MTQTPRDRDDDLETRFAEIVSHWDEDPPARPERPRPAAPPGPDVEDWPADLRRPRTTPGADDEAQAASSDPGWRAYSLPEPDDEAFEPPTPARLPGLRESPWFWVSLLGIGGGGLTLIALAIFAPEGGGRLMPAAFLAFVIGFGALVVRHSSRKEREDPKGWEDDSGTQL